jgi:site-specific recombinase XerD
MQKQYQIGSGGQIMPFGHQPGQQATNYKRTFPAEVLTPDEVAAILAQCSATSRTGIRNRALLTLLYRSGLRISEALALKPSGVDFRRHSVRVLHGKGDKATTRGFHPSADDALARWTDTRKGLALRNGPLFCTLQGGELSDRYVRNLLHRLADKAGIEKRVHPHGLRHTFADELRAAGVDVGAISKLLGHSSIAVTSRYLDHLSNAQAVAALEGVELPELGA